MALSVRRFLLIASCLRDTESTIFISGIQAVAQSVRRFVPSASVDVVQFLGHTVASRQKVGSQETLAACVGGEYSRGRHTQLAQQH